MRDGNLRPRLGAGAFIGPFDAPAGTRDACFCTRAVWLSRQNHRQSRSPTGAFETRCTWQIGTRCRVSLNHGCCMDCKNADSLMHRPSHHLWVAKVNYKCVHTNSVTHNQHSRVETSTIAVERGTCAYYYLQATGSKQITHRVERLLQFHWQNTQSMSHKGYQVFQAWQRTACYPKKVRTKAIQHIRKTKWITFETPGPIAN